MVWLGNLSTCHDITIQFSLPQVEYPLGGNSKKGSHIYVLLQVVWVILLFDINVVMMIPWWLDVTIVQSDVTIVVPWQLSTRSNHDYLFCYCPLVDILFKVLRIVIKLQPTVSWEANNHTSRCGWIQQLPLLEVCPL